MAEHEQSPIIQTTPNNSLSNPIIIQQETSGFPVSVILNETNYTLWSQLMKMRIGARNKVGYLTGAVAKPALNDPNYDIWITENHRVKSWLIESMSPHLMQRFIRLVTAREIWEAVSKTFYDGSDETRLFELNQKSFSTTQNGRSLSTYYNELVAIFQEIDHRSTTQEQSVEGIIHLHAAMMRLRVHIFLSGLDPEYDQIRGEILRKEPKLDLEAAYACVRRESQQRQVMGFSRLAPENTAMITHQTNEGQVLVLPKGEIIMFVLTVVKLVIPNNVLRTYWIPRMVGFFEETTEDNCRESCNGHFGCKFFNPGGNFDSYCKFNSAR